MVSNEKLNEQEERELSQGLALYEMTKTEGFEILSNWLKDRAYHTWADPRETSNQEEWIWRELNAFHASNNAKELLEAISQSISRAEYLDKVKKGEIAKGRMRI